MQSIEKHQKYMQRCLQLAKNGKGTTYPNPMVGAVVVYESRIIGEGWHQRAGEEHAEVRAIESVVNQELLPLSSIYVSLEPCAHFGKTPPCADLIVKSGIRKVYIGCKDPFAKVNGLGIQKLKDAGCEVTVGILETACLELNKRFFTFHRKKRPYIFLKWAQSTDGFISPNNQLRKDQPPLPYWITNKISRQYVHKQRASEQAILIGTHTVIADNPSLNTRLWKGSDCLRVVLDLELKLDYQNLKVFNSSQKTLVITSLNHKDKAVLQTLSKKLDFGFVNCDKQSQNATCHKSIPHQICDILYSHHIQSLIIEGGSYTLQSFIDKQLWDEAYVFTNPEKFFTSGVVAPTLNSLFKIKVQQEMSLINDKLIKYKHLIP